jgi:hypothetical protein
MYNTSDNGIDHSKNSLDAVNMERNKKVTSLAENTDLPVQMLNLILPYLQEVTFKVGNIDISNNKASGVEVNFRFQAPKSKTVKTHQAKKEKTIFDKLCLFFVKQSITAFFQFIIMGFLQFLPHIMFLIFSLVLVVQLLLLNPLYQKSYLFVLLISNEIQKIIT